LIAGIKNEEISNLHREIPVLSGVPYLGNMFKWDSNSVKKQTFAIIITQIDNNSSF
jgi:type II secretory pathway component GspD/PulD (secretin)